MVCRDCGGELKETNVVGMDKSFRCDKCGGCWVEGWVINAMAEGKETKITKYEIRDKRYDLDKFNCPGDGSNMVKFESEEMPVGVNIFRCEKCKKMWIPGDEIFNLAKAFEIKRNYQNIWKKKGDLRNFALPIVLTLVLVAGLGMVNRQVGNRQLWMTEAVNISKTELRFLGDGKVEIKLITKDDLGQIEYRLNGSEIWLTAPVVTQGEQKVAIAEGLKPGDKFLIKVNGKIFQVTVGKSE